MIERFDAKVRKTDGCWLWTGAVNDKGYGLFRFNGKTTRAHRVAWRLRYGPIPDGMSVCHKCDARSCVNPRHLFLGTQADNVHDAVAKGRHQRGERNGHARVTTDQVQRIRSSNLSTRKLAVRFGISKSQAHCIKSGIWWKHV